jgi:hypothetical protein
VTDHDRDEQRQHWAAETAALNRILRTLLGGGIAIGTILFGIVWWAATSDGRITVLERRELALTVKTEANRERIEDVSRRQASADVVLAEIRAQIAEIYRTTHRIERELFASARAQSQRSTEPTP